MKSFLKGSEASEVSVISQRLRDYLKSDLTHNSLFFISFLICLIHLVTFPPQLPNKLLSPSETPP